MIDLRAYGYQGDKTAGGPEGCLPARVTAVHRGLYQAICERGETWARLKASVYYQPGGAFDTGYGRELYPTVGDFVWLQYQERGDSLITGTMERRSFFSRRAAHIDQGEQIVAANFDTVFILMSLNQNFNGKRLERYLTAAWQSGGTPVVLLTKVDLAGEPEGMIRQAERVAARVEVIPVSAYTGEGMERLEPWIAQGKTIVLLGSSGVGKSSLVNALSGEERMKVNAVREEDARGRHTTTHRQLLRLPSGALVIDTPGMRALGMWDISDGLETAFMEIEELAARCRFTDCTHKNEPGCAVRSALESGQLEASRWENYQNLRREARYAGQKEWVREMRRQKAAGPGKKKKPDRKKGGIYNKD